MASGIDAVQARATNMERKGQIQGNGTGRRVRAGPRYVFQVDSDSAGAVIRVLDTHTDRIFREIPVEEFLAFARHSKNVKAFLFGQVQNPRKAQ